MTVKFENITEAQAITLETMFAVWCRLGRVGSSRWTAFFADGDGNFRPKITIDGKEAEESPLVDVNNCIEPIKRCVTHNGDNQLLEVPIWRTEYEVYFFDFDSVAWKIRDEIINLVD